MKRLYQLIAGSIAILLFTVSSISLIAEEKIPEIIKRLEPSVVVILTYKNGVNTGQASGFFISAEGDIITNYHVLQDADSIEIKTSDGKSYPVTKILAEDKEGDLIRISSEVPKSKVKPVALSKSKPAVGERILVIGSPLGLEKTVSDGIVSAVREIPGLGNIIQTTAPVSPGSSGSPLVNMNGEIIGIISFQIVEGQNLNFAIPSERIAGLTPIKEKTLNQWVLDRILEWLDSTVRLYCLGLSAIICDNYEEAINFFKQAIDTDPKYADAYIEMGYCYNKIGRYNEAIECFKQAIRIEPDYARAHYNLGIIYDDLGRYYEAIECYKQAIRIKPDYAEAHCNLGNSYINLGRYNEAIESYKQAIRIEPDDAYVHCALGGAYYDLGRYYEAIECYKQAIRIEPDDAYVHCALGGAYYNLGRYNEAIDCFKQAIRINPDYASAHFTLGLTYLIIEDKGSALEEYKILKNLDKERANELFNFIYK